MAATGTPTPNIGLRIPQGTDPASVADINYNSTVIDQKVGPVGNTSLQEQIDSAEEAMAYVVNGNDAPSGGIPSGKYVYVKNNTNGIATGMYITTAAISSGATVSASSLSACSEGAVNSLNSNLKNLIEFKEITIGTFNMGSGGYADYTASLPTTPTGKSLIGSFISNFGNNQPGAISSLVPRGNSLWLLGVPNGQYQGIKVMLMYVQTNSVAIS